MERKRAGGQHQTMQGLVGLWRTLEWEGFKPGSHVAGIRVEDTQVGTSLQCWCQGHCLCGEGKATGHGVRGQEQVVALSWEVRVLGQSRNPSQQRVGDSTQLA